MNDYAAAIATGTALGLAHTAHCAAMCGAFALRGAGLGAKRSATLGFASWWAGKTFAYLFVGAAAGSVGRELVDRLPRLQAALGALTAVLLFLAAWRLVRGRRSSSATGALSWIGRALSSAAGAAARQGSFAFGAVTGLLPCGPVWIAAIAAAATQRPLVGLVLMTSLSIGTLPVLLAVVLAGRGLLPRLSARSMRAAAVVLLVLAGGFAAWRSQDVFAEPTIEVAPPCCR